MVPGPGLLEQGTILSKNYVDFSNRFAVITLNSEALKGFVNLILFVLSIYFIMLFISFPGESIYFKGV